ncbi:MAG: hypothetical protein H6741_11060 [Alphaproteobacteria bacterium]|nr:hypothetical protein [Alphaproteobacteria bacterium]
MRTALMVLGLAALTACDRDALYAENTLSENVYEAYAECSAGEISFLAAKHNIQTAFENCGSNNFVYFAWAPDGIQLYFQLPMSAHIMNAEDKSAGTLPTEVPIAGVAWLARELLVLPLGPPEDDGKDRLVLFDRVQASMQTINLDVKAPADLQAAGTRDKVYFTAADANGERGVYLADFTTLSYGPAFPWVAELVGQGALTSFTYTHELGLAAVGVGETVHVVVAESGEVKHRFEDATRGVVHPEGRYIALESLGDPISPFDQRSWDELSPEAREREKRRTEEWLARQPEWVPKEINPPTIDIVDVEVGKRFRFNSFYGDRFQWYPSPYYASFVLWGLEGKEVNKNVALTNLHERLRMAGNGTSPWASSSTPGQPAAPRSPSPRSSRTDRGGQVRGEAQRPGPQALTQTLRELAEGLLAEGHARGLRLAADLLAVDLHAGREHAPVRRVGAGDAEHAVHRAAVEVQANGEALDAHVIALGDVVAVAGERVGDGREGLQVHPALPHRRRGLEGAGGHVDVDGPHELLAVVADLELHRPVEVGMQRVGELGQGLARREEALVERPDALPRDLDGHDLPGAVLRGVSGRRGLRVGLLGELRHGGLSLSLHHLGLRLVGAAREPAQREREPGEDHRAPWALTSRIRPCLRFTSRRARSKAIS